MGKQKTIIHLLSELKYKREQSLWVYTITTDEKDLVYPKIFLGHVYEQPLASYRRLRLIALFKSIGIVDGGEVYIVTSSCYYGQEVFAYGSTTQEKWILTDTWEIVDTSDDRIQNKI